MPRLHTDRLYEGELQKIRISKDVSGSCYAPAVRGQAAITLHDGRVEVPIVLDRSLFSGEGPIEIKLKLYIK